MFLESLVLSDSLKAVQKDYIPTCLFTFYYLALVQRYRVYVGPTLINPRSTNQDKITMQMSLVNYYYH